MKSKVLFLGCNHNEIPYLENLQERGFYVVATDMNPDAPGMKIADSSIVCGYDDFEGLEDAISKEGPEHFDKVFTASAQFAHIGASTYLKKLGISYPSMDSVIACLDKKLFILYFKRME